MWHERAEAPPAMAGMNVDICIQPSHTVRMNVAIARQLTLRRADQQRPRRHIAPAPPVIQNILHSPVIGFAGLCQVAGPDEAEDPLCPLLIVTALAPRSIA